MKSGRVISRERFAAHATAYVTSTAHASVDELNLLVEMVSPAPDWRVLDVATGGGHTALRFAPEVRRVLATDITPEMLRAARTYIAGSRATGVEYGYAAAEELPFADAAFDLVTCRIAPHHFDDCARFVHESARVLKSGGMLLIQDHLIPDDPIASRHLEDFERLRDPSHHRAFSETEWKAMFEAAGLVVERVETVIKQHDFVAWATRQGCNDDVVSQLRRMLDSASGIAREWMSPRHLETNAPGFSARHILMAGRK